VSARQRRAVIIGAGHNGLIAGCYLAREGWEVTALERRERVGGATSTEERFPGHRFDMHSVAPFSTMLTPDGQAVRFYRDVERTCDDIARVDPAEAQRYGRFIRKFDSFVLGSTSMFRRNARSDLLRSLPGILRWLRGSGLWGAMGELFSSYGRLLDSCCEAEWMKAALAALAAHATVGPDMPGGAYYVMWQAAYHRYGMWHARGGSGALADALRRRFESWGGKVLTEAEVTGLEVRGGGVMGARLAAGQAIDAPVVITTVSPRIVLGEWLPEGAIGHELRRHIGAVRTANVVQFIVHITADRLPPYRGTDGMADAWNGMAAMSRSLDQVSHCFRQAELGLIPNDPSVYIFTPSAIDDSLAPSGSHSIYLASPAFPGRLAQGSWREQGMPAAERLADRVEEYAPGFQSQRHRHAAVHARGH
jgi:phytoene dehydrogenase-like protein